ncbi:MAG: cytochrome c3 family protein [Candidatus Thiodiazotropha sp.]
MKYRKLLLVVTLNLAVLIGLAIVWPHLMISPGKPITAHAEIATDCFACHAPFIGSTPEKCIACHKVEDIGLKTTKGAPIGAEKKQVAFHQQLIEADCVACHSDHNGVMAFRPISQFSHELVAVTMREQCETCHANPGDVLHRKIGGNCSQCHAIDGWKPATFDHDDYFRFDRHHTTECATCHIDDDFDSYTCYGCHEHSRSSVRSEHVEEGIFDYEICVECHRSGDEDEAEWRWRSRYEDTRRTGREPIFDGEKKGRFRGWRDEDDDEGYRRRHDDD